ncbi:MAG: branched-chain amino acid ABC transporter permease [Acidimicrobiales bacterium]
MGGARAVALAPTGAGRLFPTRGSRNCTLALVAAVAAFPLVAPSEFWLSVLLFVGATAVGAMGLNLLTGFTGQVSLGHAFFLGLGAYTACYLGNPVDGDPAGRGLPMLVWLPAAVAVPAVVGLVVGPAALRLKGNYLAVVSLGLVFLGAQVFRQWESVTGGSDGTSVVPSLSVGPLDFSGIGGLTRNQSLFFLVWGLVGITALASKNLVRSRPGRAMQAVRDRDVAAEILGISLARYKLGAFAISSGLAGLSGALYAVVLTFIEPGTWSLPLSIQFVAMVIVGGIGTTMGGVLGALFVGALPEVVKHYSASIPFVAHTASEDGLSLPQLNQILFGLAIVGFLVLEPRGLAALWLRARRSAQAWSFWP